MGSFFDWFRAFHRVTPASQGPRDAGSYHRRRLLQEQQLARSAGSIAARDAHRRLAAQHRIALERVERNGTTPSSAD